MGHCLCLPLVYWSLSLHYRTNTCRYLAVGNRHRIYSPICLHQPVEMVSSAVGPICRSFLVCCAARLGHFRQPSLFTWRSNCLDQISALRRCMHVLAWDGTGSIKLDVRDNGTIHCYHDFGFGCRVWQCDSTVINVP